MDSDTTGAAATRRPVSVVLISLLFVTAGGLGLWHHADDLLGDRGVSAEGAWVLIIRLLTIVLGVALFLGFRWGRWGIYAWMAYHLGLSLMHPLSDLVVHAVLFGIITFFLTRPAVNAFCRR
jgi:hypothetical protein